MVRVHRAQAGIGHVHELAIGTEVFAQKAVRLRRHIVGVHDVAPHAYLAGGRGRGFDVHLDGVEIGRRQGELAAVDIHPHGGHPRMLALGEEFTFAVDDEKTAVVGEAPRERGGMRERNAAQRLDGIDVDCGERDGHEGVTRDFVNVLSYFRRAV